MNGISIWHTYGCIVISVRVRSVESMCYAIWNNLGQLLDPNFSWVTPTLATGALRWLIIKHAQQGHVIHDDVIKWKHFPCYWPFVWGIHRSPVNSLHKGQWLGALMFSLICVWINGWVNNREAGDLRRYHAHCDVIVMTSFHRFSHMAKRFVGSISWLDWHNGK